MPYGALLAHEQSSYYGKVSASKTVESQVHSIYDFCSLVEGPVLAALVCYTSRAYSAQVAALCIFADAINFGGSKAAQSYSEVFLPAALLAVCPPPECVSDDDQLLGVCAAAYGLGKRVTVQPSFCCLTTAAAHTHEFSWRAHTMVSSWLGF